MKALKLALAAALASVALTGAAHAAYVDLGNDRNTAPFGSEWASLFSYDESPATEIRAQDSGYDRNAYAFVIVPIQVGTRVAGPGANPRPQEPVSFEDGTIGRGVYSD